MVSYGTKKPQNSVDTLNNLWPFGEDKADKCLLMIYLTHLFPLPIVCTNPPRVSISSFLLNSTSFWIPSAVSSGFKASKCPSKHAIETQVRNPTLLFWELITCNLAKQLECRDFKSKFWPIHLEKFLSDLFLASRIMTNQYPFWREITESRSKLVIPQRGWYNNTSFIRSGWQFSNKRGANYDTKEFSLLWTGFDKIGAS